MIVTQEKTKNNAISKNVRQIILIDSETIRKPFGQRYCHAQDQQIKGLATKLDLVKSLIEVDIFAFTDYSTLVKANMFGLTQAKYACGFLLQMFDVLKGTFFATNFLEITEHSELILYSKNSTLTINPIAEDLKMNKARDKFASSDRSEILLSVPTSYNCGQQILNYFKDPSENSYDLKIISNNSKYEQFASNNSIIFEDGDVWLQKVINDDYG